MPSDPHISGAGLVLLSLGSFKSAYGMIARAKQIANLFDPIEGRGLSDGRQMRSFGCATPSVLHNLEVEPHGAMPSSLIARHGVAGLLKHIEIGSNGAREHRFDSINLLCSSQEIAIVVAQRLCRNHGEHQ